MSFVMNLYANKSDSRYVTKTLQSMGVITTVNFRDDYDVINPVFIIQTDGGTILNANAQLYPEATFKHDLMTGLINYISISDNSFLRYYYILNATYRQNNIIELRCHEDVLMTYKTGIRLSTGIVRRNENLYNLYIKDPKINVYEKPVIKQQVFAKGFTNTSTSITYMLTTLGCTPRKKSDYIEYKFDIHGFDGGINASNGGVFIVIPSARIEGIEVNGVITPLEGDVWDYWYNNSGDSFVYDWAIFNKSALNYVENPDSLDDYYESDEWCIGQIVGYTSSKRVQVNIKRTFSLQTTTRLCVWYVLQPHGLEFYTDNTSTTADRHRCYDDALKITRAYSPGQTQPVIDLMLTYH